MEDRRFNRREVLVMFAATGALMALGASGESSKCILTPELTEGPFFVDEKLNRSNIIAGQQGLPLNLNINVYNANSQACSPIHDVHVDIWHSNAQGIYSDVNFLGSAGESFLRGYQVTDSNGKVTFQTIYPGWYMGRTPHIHLKARVFNGSGEEAVEATTQLFFDDSISDQVYASNAPYNNRGGRRLRNSQDGIYGGRSSLLVPLKGSVTKGYSGTISIGISA